MGFAELFNRLYYAVYITIDYTINRPISFVIEWLFARPLYALPSFRRHLKKKGLTYDSWMATSKTGVMTVRLFRMVDFVMCSVLALPIFIVYQILMIVYGRPFREFLHEHIMLFFFSAYIVAALFVTVFCWWKEHYLTWFRKFEKEPVKTRAVWVVAMLLASAFLATLLVVSYRHAAAVTGL